MDSRLALAITILSAFLSVFLYRQIRLSLEDIQYTPEEHTFTPARTGPTAQEGQIFSKPVYGINSFPGSRQLRTIYGTIHVFEWGPEDGEKVLLVHGLGTPCIALGGMAKELVRKGYRVMIYDLFGRGYSDAPNDLVFDARLYTTQVLLVLSSPLPWTGTSAFHIIGFSLGGSIAVAFAAYHAAMLRSVALWTEDDLAFDDVPIAEDRPHVTVGDVIRWQLRANAGFVQSYLSTLRSALVYRRHDRTWRILTDELAKRRAVKSLPGLPGGKICLIVAKRDIIVVGDECASDAAEMLGTDAVEIHVLSGGHVIAISRSRDVISIATGFWNKQL
ncbi:Alpha/Beta hydrolase protein [Aspergillus fruticulosus]